MRSTMAVLLAAGLTAASFVAHAGGPEIGVSIQIAQPGVYGRIDLGRFPQPQVVVPQPVVVAPPPPPPRGVLVVQPPQPVYMWVPPGHRKNWRKHCREYNACGVPVYFVRDEWYDRNVQTRGRGDDDHGKGRGRGRGKGRDD